MEPVAFLLLIAAGAAAYVTTVWLATESRAIRLWAVRALAGSLVLGLDAAFNSLCGIAENRSELFYERCHGSGPYVPLYAIPLLLAAPLLRRFASGALVLATVAVVMTVALAIPMRLLSV